MKNSKMETLKAKKEQIEARIKNLEAKERLKQKKQDTRRKILIGAMITEQMGKTEETKSKVMASLDGFLTRPMDRELFGLPEKGKVQKLNPERKTDETPKQTEKRKSA